MTYLNIQDPKVRQGIAQQLLRWRRDLHRLKRSRASVQLIREWIYGFRHALEIIDDS